MDLVAHVNALHWDGPLRGWLTCVARQSSPTEIEITVGLGVSTPTVISVAKPARPNCDDAAAVTRQIIDLAASLLAEAAMSLLRRGPKLDLREPTMADLHAKLVETEEKLAVTQVALEQARRRRDHVVAMSRANGVTL